MSSSKRSRWEHTTSCITNGEISFSNPYYITEWVHKRKYTWYRTAIMLGQVLTHSPADGRFLLLQSMFHDGALLFPVTSCRPQETCTASVGADNFDSETKRT